MDDLISRQAAIDAICGECQGNCIPCEHYPCGEIKALEQLPSVRPERKSGRWIPKFDGQFKGGAYWFCCSECERVVPDVRNGGWSFCPQCGAKMEE